MLRLVTVLAASVALSVAHPLNLFKIDITPEEAQQYLNQLPFSEPQLSARTNVLPLVRYDSPQFRSASAGPTLGHYWKNGKEIDNVDDYVEEVYDASQYHGQDGLGAFAYGYKTPESSKVENRARSGDVQGTYEFKAGNNELIKVRYWADSEGFHQEDNIPKVELQPAQETEEVRQARLAHQKAWEEAAAAAAQQPDPQGEYSQYSERQVLPGGNAYPIQQAPSYQQDYQHSASEPQAAVAPRDGKAYTGNQAYGQQQKPVQQQQYGQQQKPAQQQQYGQQQFSQQQQQFGQQQQLGGKYGQNSAQASAQYGQQQQYQQSGQQEGKYEEPEPTGPPRGFFYSFDYPVSILVRKDAQGENGPVNPGKPVDHDTVGVYANYQ